MTPFEEKILWDSLEACHAYRDLHDPAVVGRLSGDAVLALMRRAGYSEEAAQKAATDQANARLDAGLSQ